MPRWAVVLGGCLALIIGASAPALILETLHPRRLSVPTPTPPSAPILQIPSQAGESDRRHEGGQYQEQETIWHRAAHDPVAVATLLLAIATGILAVASWRAADDTRRSLLLAQRPRIRIRNVVVRPTGPATYIKSAFFPRELVTGQLYIVNVGGTRARLIEAHCEVYWTNTGIRTLPMERPYEGQDPNIPDLSVHLEPGQSCPLPFSSDRQLGVIESDQIHDDDLLIYVLGFVAYVDDLEITRRTAFCRRYDPMRRRFFAVDDPDYEHEE